MIARGQGRIINPVTGVAHFAYFSGYCAGKAVLIRFSECLAAEVRPHGVAVFPIGPGTVRTAMSEYSLNSPEGRRWLPWFKRISTAYCRTMPRTAAVRTTNASARARGTRGYPPMISSCTSTLPRVAWE
jgi:NAD(P)-dependent dehydrogenase (short-subunit alcohol dehydrogenase family)